MTDLSAAAARHRQLRGAVYTADATRIVDMLRLHGPGDTLQLAGEGLLIALGQYREEVRPLAETCAAALREREWIGDDDLVEELDAALAGVSRADLRPVPVDLEQLSGALEGDPAYSGGRLDLRTGDVWPGESWELSGSAEEDDEDAEGGDRWLYIESEASRAGYDDMADFAESVQDERLAELLTVALDGRGAFRRFKDVLQGQPEELERYYGFSDERRRGRARSWLAGEGYRPVPRPR
ncbi:MAG: hypothetical protein DLM67_19585 [Candidatus Nephthysia bennettiae]|uniref:Uncharacterized protein n=1 Tax=Candidatus Nephthysia bennettiae TaxID=3127016 RepID=A0A934JXE2_9BACT|nr:hypothetical protein [Candidatus Dormibacteraeota bacterium]MBJ7611847.1 hypothetical protein [Candidatus Dormibacteraeota bacterium]PZR88958.1 MAG: hypothetical protein DLM67_19585 [Candidatus Dormibacteraeota bacterium]